MRVLLRLPMRVGVVHFTEPTCSSLMELSLNTIQLTEPELTHASVGRELQQRDDPDDNDRDRGYIGRPYIGSVDGDALVDHSFG